MLPMAEAKVEACPTWTTGPVLGTNADGDDSEKVGSTTMARYVPEPSVHRTLASLAPAALTLRVVVLLS